VTDWPVVWVATIAVAVVVMAVVQVVILLVAARTARQTTETLQQIRQDMKPIVEKANRISDDAARATALAVAQIERIDGMLDSTARRLDETLGAVQGAIVGPARQGAAFVAAMRAAIAVFRSIGDRRRSDQDEEEALFVG
jgi:predicted PurR-regulated permease PerM